ncbi:MULTISPECIES: hypothetical protein [Olivibacter]|uniref:Beta/gamma crystallin n=2 Tax=Olivibacter TaxID=376469 RepID=A0ABV6HEM0_9SPHI|nr:hypothetical protein [Olivibacter sp. 47]MCL4641895.1 PepSY domain-containing protein [Olivibacter sp. UJ_SKK_5.1]MDM8177858.1 hypothetical protein [Olivibacter sp. 47]
MKKLLMSLVAVAAMSTAAFAHSGAKAMENNTAKRTTMHKAITGEGFIEVSREIKAIKKGYKRLQACHYTVNYYNGGGIRYNSVTYSTNVGGSGDVFGSCAEFFQFIDNGHRAQGFSITKGAF